MPVSVDTHKSPVVSPLGGLPVVPCGIAATFHVCVLSFHASAGWPYPIVPLQPSGCVSSGSPE